MGEGMTAKQGFSKGQLFSLASVYVVLQVWSSHSDWVVLLEDDRSPVVVWGRSVASVVGGSLNAGTNRICWLRRSRISHRQRDCVELVWAGNASLTILTKASACGAGLANRRQQLVESNAALAGACDVIFCAVTADQALNAAEQTAPFLGSRHYYCDVNSVSPQMKQAIGRTVSRGGARFVESAMMAPVPPHAHRKVPVASGRRGGTRISWKCSHPSACAWKLSPPIKSGEPRR